MVKFQIETDNGTKYCNCPESWDEVNLGQLIRYDAWAASKGDTVGLLSAFTYTDYSYLAESKSNNLWGPLYSVLGFVYKEPIQWDKLKVPDSIRLDGVDCKIPKKIGLTMFAQKVNALNLIADESKTDKEKILRILAIYLQPIYDGRWIPERLDHIENHCRYLNAKEAFPIGNFFFRKLLKTKNYGMIGFYPFLLITKKRLLENLPGLKGLKDLMTFNS
jgi:hypothetical protein